MADYMKKIIKNSLNHKVALENLSNPPFESLYEKYQKRDIITEKSFVYRTRAKVSYFYFNSNKKAVLTTIICIFILSLLLYEPTRVFAEQVLKKIYVVYEENGDYKIKQIEVPEENKTQTPPEVPDVTNLIDTEMSDRLGYKVVIPSELPDKYLMNSKSILKAGDNETDEKEFVSVRYLKQNNDISEEEWISLNITNLRWPLVGTRFILDGIEFYYKESGVAEYQWSIDEQGKMIVDLEKQPDGIDLVHKLAWRIDNVTYSLSDVSGRDLTKEQLVEIAKPIVDKLIRK